MTDLVSLIDDDSLGVAVRAADALEKLSRNHPDRLNPHKQTLMTWPTIAIRPEQLWMYCLITPRLKLTQREAVTAAQSMESYLTHESSILKTNAMHGLVELGMQFPSMRTKSEIVLRVVLKNGTPAMKARARKLKLRLERAS